jgi:hypothetical protein
MMKAHAPTVHLSWDYQSEHSPNCSSSAALSCNLSNALRAWSHWAALGVGEAYKLLGSKALRQFLPKAHKTNHVFFFPHNVFRLKIG